MRRYLIEALYDAMHGQYWDLLQTADFRDNRSLSIADQRDVSLGKGTLLRHGTRQVRHAEQEYPFSSMMRRAITTSPLRTCRCKPVTNPEIMTHLGCRS